MTVFHLLGLDVIATLPGVGFDRVLGGCPEWIAIDVSRSMRSGRGGLDSGFEDMRQLLERRRRVGQRQARQEARGVDTVRAAIISDVLGHGADIAGILDRALAAPNGRSRDRSPGGRLPA